MISHKINKRRYRPCRYRKQLPLFLCKAFAEVRSAYAIITRLHVCYLNCIKGTLVAARVIAAFANVTLNSFIIHNIHLPQDIILLKKI